VDKPNLAPAFTVRRTDRDVFVVTFQDVTSDFEQWVLLRSDVHFDSKHARHELEIEHLELAKQRRALILDFGDLFDAMQGREDRRRSYRDVDLALLEGDRYFQNLVEFGAKRYAPYAENFLLLSRGNHEESILIRNNFDLVSALAQRLHSLGSPVVVGGIGGYILFHVVFKNSKHNDTVVLRWHHGATAAAPVTRGTIEANRQSVWLTNADIVVNGHNHENYLFYQKRERVNKAGKVEFPLTAFVRTPGYKQIRKDGNLGEGWEHVQNHSPKANGCAWIRFYIRNKQLRYEITLSLD
jgi:UDP-2,3-diacylglucosamine pyrophosphatase LpxH